MTRTPFTIAAANRFIAVGCNNHALLTSTEPSIVGCQPTCDEELKPEGRDPPCSGNRCCQTQLPYYLWVFQSKFEKVEEKDTEECKFAFMAENSWFESNVKNPYKVLNKKFVPMIMDWKINGTALASLGIDEEATNSTTRYYNGHGFPYPNNTYLTCREDVDECKNPKVVSKCSGSCVNTRGSYKCEGRNSWIVILGKSLRKFFYI
ncbi:hypothetical protein GH714_033014 [Hevea brasiliensis]|uniref:Wall-associated receptor kinase domain-containing protein n=1 Tax=Hevea brasiliensis TaxID=3981 RepID=A0A6A6NE03_HEVBR|nr:hypothetical protein GH714_033014 [Hevea brasiliensis]